MHEIHCLPLVEYYVLCLFFFLFFCRSARFRRSGQSGHPAGAPAGGPEDLCTEEEAPQTSHVPQDADEDY